ncbi:uncharacterized protein EV420DRAFT_1514980 [Desarmillaria tabescens]|uniref:Methyltransferase domain-containing protein n=1 Tax=Armillaria tabescens TaxID=1929756 RepID=A0AA39NH84_ARMTA|nr:uncharacterized protein EV420DRAFT_1514980 [Desarmillaria tabescens]KAK0465575.1 hypothetical protein EV420DRAFT_1514980 [Desarmillaria tabescens]
MQSLVSTTTTLAPPTSPPRPLSAAGRVSTGDGKRQPRLKESSFTIKFGSRYHSFDNEKAPYPLCYDRHVLELESLDNRFVKHLRGGSGTGTWVLDAAKEWPKCEFVGFDLVNIQIPLKLLDPSIAERIAWVHGNFLTTKLPFDDDEFDHVHIQSIARGVPENKWDVLFDEINRILRPGGCVEILEDDLVFPYLPRWFTAPLRARPRRSTSVHFPDDTPIQDMPSHDHALLESLYKSVFEHRFINMKPSALLPSYFATYFRHVTLGPVISFPMPPVPPLQPLPPQIVTTYAIEPGSDTLDPRVSSPTPTPSVRPASLSFSSTISSGTGITSSTPDSSTTVSTLFSMNAEPKVEVAFPSDTSRPAPSITTLNLNPTENHTPPPPFVPYMLDTSSTETTTVASIPPSLFSEERLLSLNVRSLAMHLYRSYQSVLACREALWEELNDRLRNRKDELKPFGWEDDEDWEGLQTRRKFEILIERYESDMQARISLWCSLNNIGWPFPPREPLNECGNAMLEARKHAPAEDLQIPCRTMRVLIGYKL